MTVYGQKGQSCNGKDEIIWFNFFFKEWWFEVQKEHIFRSQIELRLFIFYPHVLFLLVNTAVRRKEEKVSAVLLTSTLLLAADQKFTVMWRCCFHRDSVTAVEAAELLPQRQRQWMQEGLMCMFYSQNLSNTPAIAQSRWETNPNRTVESLFIYFQETLLFIVISPSNLFTGHFVESALQINL